MASALSDLIDRLVPDTIPSISLTVRVAGQEIFHQTSGFACLEPRIVAQEDQVYDLASLTKALVGTSITARLVESGALTYDQPIAHILPGLDRRITVKHLLTHSAGFPAHIKFYEQFDQWGSGATRRAILDAARHTRLVAPPGVNHCYSDVGFLVLLDLLETIGQDSIDSLFAVDGFYWGHSQAAATEFCPVRQRLIRGTVHDLNCFALGGKSTHAGLFGNARQVARFADTLLDIPRMRRIRQLVGPGSHRGGWDTISPGYTSTGSYFPLDTVGHLGYTGCSLWMSPAKRTVVTLLTNRIHPTDTLDAIRAVRPQIHDAVATMLGWES
ncbi:MAG: beta-lactamase family protein [Proteobacteria bacterium]|nr:beta-lactamase family protein [Pseudomonadota bacterium]